ncbi:MAG: hypothetical protein ACREFC_08480 [Stellaceae bacterium]
MNGDRERKDPLPLIRNGSGPETPPEANHAEPLLRAFGDEPAVTRDSTFVVPSDLRAAYRAGNSRPILVIAAFLVFCAIGGGYAYLRITAVEAPPPVAETTAKPAPQPAAAEPYKTNPAPAQTAQPAPVSAPPPVAKVQQAPAPVVDEAAAARARERLKAAEAARLAEQQARIKREQAEAAAKAAEQARLAAVKRHEEKLRAERQRKEAAARRAAEARAKQEQALQNKLDQATVVPPAQPPDEDEAAPPPPRQKHARFVPRNSSDDDGPPLDAGDLPPRSAGDENQ